MIFIYLLNSVPNFNFFIISFLFNIIFLTIYIIEKISYKGIINIFKEISQINLIKIEKCKIINETLLVVKSYLLSNKVDNKIVIRYLEVIMDKIKELEKIDKETVEKIEEFVSKK